MNYEINYRGKKAILRIPIGDAENVDIKILNENEILRTLRKDLPSLPVPEVLYSSYTPSYSIHSYLEGQVLEKISPNYRIIDENVIESLASIMAMLHRYDNEDLRSKSSKILGSNCKVFYKTIYTNYMNLILKYIQYDKKLFQKLSFPKYPEILINQSHEIEKRDLVFSHVDLHRKNLIINDNHANIKRINGMTRDQIPNFSYAYHDIISGILDWELAVYADPFFDITVHIHKMKYVKGQEEIFLNNYMDLMEIWDVEILKKMIKIYRKLEDTKSAYVDAVRLLNYRNHKLYPQYLSSYLAKLDRAFSNWGLELHLDEIQLDNIIQRH